MQKEIVILDNGSGTVHNISYHEETDMPWSEDDLIELMENRGFDTSNCQWMVCFADDILINTEGKV